ncbi:MAG TPA: DUF167 domain-containing protein [Rubrivivax sp.]|nr:DUF167 domain-containing protein [Rubrivivax sp.]
MRKNVQSATASGRQLIDVKVKPGARVSQLTRADDGSWLAQLKSAPVEGKANQELITLVARHFGCAKSSVSIRSGAAARRKLVQIDGA